MHTTRGSGDRIRCACETTQPLTEGDTVTVEAYPSAANSVEIDASQQNSHLEINQIE